MNDIKRGLIGVLDERGLLDAAGGSLYSGWNAWRPGRYLLLGINPGGTGSQTVRQHLETVGEDWSEYETDWSHTALAQQALSIASALQVRIQELPASNAVFIKSRNVASLESPEALFETCWPIHQWILRTVRPSIIVSMGTSNFISAFGFLARKSTRQEPGWRRTKVDGIKHCGVTFELGDGTRLESHLIGIPHAASNRGARKRWVPETQLPRLRELAGIA